MEKSTNRKKNALREAVIYKAALVPNGTKSRPNYMDLLYRNA